MNTVAVDNIIQTLEGLTGGLPYPSREWRREKKVPKGPWGDILAGLLYAREYGIITWGEAARLWQLADAYGDFLEKNGTYLVRA